MTPPEETESPAAEEAPAPTPKKSAARARTTPKPKEEAEEKAEKKTSAAASKASDEEAGEEEEEEEAPRAPRRPKLEGRETRLLAARAAGDERRPRFVRQQFYRYARLERRGAWRRPRGLQSKQRRHYGYRARLVRVGYRSPAAVRGRTPTGFVPVVVHNAHELEAVDAAKEAALFARTIGTRKRLVLEETARKRGVKVLNPVVKDEHED